MYILMLVSHGFLGQTCMIRTALQIFKLYLSKEGVQKSLQKEKEWQEKQRKEKDWNGKKSKEKEKLEKERSQFSWQSQYLVTKEVPFCEEVWHEMRLCKVDRVPTWRGFSMQDNASWISKPRKVSSTQTGCRLTGSWTDHLCYFCFVAFAFKFSWFWISVTRKFVIA